MKPVAFVSALLLALSLTSHPVSSATETAAQDKALQSALEAADVMPKGFIGNTFIC